MSRLFLIAAIATALVACTRQLPSQQSVKVTDPLVRSLSARYGPAELADEAIILYVSENDGRILRGCSQSFCRQQRGLRFLVARGNSRDLSPHIKPVGSQQEFTYYFAIDGAVSPFGVISFPSPKGKPVWIQRSWGDGAPVDSMTADFAVDQSHYGRYQYNGDNAEAHRNAFKAIRAFLEQAKVW